MENISKISQLFWYNKIKDKDPINELNNKVESFNLSIELVELSFLSKIANNNVLSQFSIICSIYSILLNKYFDNYKGVITSYNSLINSKDNNPFILEDNNNLVKKSFKEHLQAISKEVQNNLTYIEYDSTILNLHSYSNFAITLNNPLISEDKCKGILLSFNITNEILELKVIYDESFVEKSLMQHFGLNFTKFLIHLQEFIDKDVNEFDFLTEKEKHKLLVEFNDTKVDYPKDKTIIQLFEKQVERVSENVAVVFEDTELTYRELNEEANQLGDYLRQNYNIQPDDLIAIKLERSEKMIVAIVGILKSGAAYVPIDPSYPQERIDYIEKDTKAKVTIDNVFFETFESEKAKYTRENLAIISKSKSLAYVIYTSGTTGKPKGVMIENSGLVNRLAWMQKAYPLDGLDTLIQKTTYSFDVSVWELLWWSINGAKLSIPKSGSEKDPAELIQNIYKNKVTVIHFVPSMLSVFLEFIKGDANQKAFLKTLKQVFVSGEALTLHQRKLFYSELPHISLMNLYGPTEASIDVSYYNCAEEHNVSSIPIGKPIDNTSLYILDEKLDLIPIGVVGKLYIAGTGLSRGYLNKYELTAEKFIDNPFEVGTKMYDTGDLARWLPDGNIEFLGRKDFQVKIRGFRIELGEIETAILEFSEDLKQVVVDVKESNKDKALIAYLACASTIDKSALRSFLQNNLPDYMIPSFYVVLENLPLTPNGKLDRKALPNVEGEDIIRKEYIAPRTKTEEILATIWQEVLGIDKIGVTDNFFDLGGHSLMISQVINRIQKQLGKTISFKIFFANPIIKELSKQLKENKYLPIPKAKEANAYPLTASQSRFWVLSQLEGGSLAYNMSGAVKLTGKLDFYILQESFLLLINQYELLRTVFKANDEGVVLQQILTFEEVVFKIDQNDCSTLESHEIKDLLQEKNSIPFDLEKAPLIRASLIKIKENQHIFFLSLHHIIGDGWSMELIIAEVIKIYNSLTSGQTVNLPKLSIQYKDYAVWLQEEINREKYQKAESYWLEQFSGELPVLNLPSFKARPSIKTYNGGQITHTFSKEFSEKLKSFSKHQNVTLFMTLMTGVKSLLYRYTGQNDIIIGTPIAGREHPELENQIGPYLNILAIRSKLDDSNKFIDLLRNEKKILLEAYQHQNYPFDALVNKLELKRDTSRSALFDVLVVLQNQGQLNSINNDEELKGLQVEEYDFRRKTSQFDISFTFAETEGLTLSIEYNTNIYDKFLIDRMFTHFENLVTESLNEPSKDIDELNYLTESEKYELLSDYNNTEIAYSKHKTIIDLFEEQVERTPDNIAVVYENKELTYRDLNEQANQLGIYLRQNYNIFPNDLVAIKLDRSEKMIVTIFGILKSGAAYVPIDPAYPKERIDYIEKDSNCKLVINEDELGVFYEKQEQHSKLNIQKINEPNDLAYVIYTSGTTGNPKGVMVENTALVNRLEWMQKSYPLSKEDVILQKTSYSFDVSVWELFWWSLNGAKLCVLKPDGQKNPNEIIEYIEMSKVSVLHFVPSMLSAFLDYLKYNKLETKKIKSLNRVFVSGEALTIDQNNNFFNQIQNISLVNLYGPTEATIDVSYFDCSKSLKLIPIGKPIDNTKLFILDTKLKPVPIGVIGKLYISGAGLARGYLNKTELTSEKFISNPFIKGELMYDTGDLTCWLPDGNIEYRGRVDHQVKIRGYRIELGEIENTILEYSENLKQVVVKVKEDNQEKVLVAYFVSSIELDKTHLREHILSKLPEYMVPSFFVELDTIPLTPNGKIDRKALPSVTGEDLIRNEYVAPKNETEQKLADIWQEVLGFEKVGITDNFFELGGHSLMVAQVLKRVHQNLAQQISFKDFFANPTIEGITKNLTQKEFNAIPKAPEQESYPLTPSQQRLWVLSQLEGGSQAYNMPAVVNLKGELNHDYFEKAFKLFIDKHEITRTSFKSDNQSGEIRQYITPKEDVNFKVELLDFTNESDADIDRYIQKANGEAFNLEHSPLLKASLLKRAASESLFFLSMHHIIGDGWSTEVLISEVVENYNKLLQGHDIEEKITSSSIQYKDYSVWLQEEIKGEKYQKAEAYWLEQFEGELPILELPSYKTRPLIQTYNGNNISHLFSKEFTGNLKAYSEQQGATLFMTLMAGVNALLYRYTRQKDIVIGTPIAGREHPDLESQIGLYLNTLAIRTRIEEDNNTFKSLLEKEKDILLSAYEHQMYPFNELVGNLNLKRDTSRSALFDVLVVFQNQRQLKLGNTAQEIKGLQVGSYDYHRKTSQFDMSYTFAEEAGQLGLTIEYNTDIYDEFLISRMFSHFESLLSQVIEPVIDDVNIESIDFLTQKERNQLLVEFNDTESDYPTDKTIIDLFEEQVAKTPDNIAVVYEDIELTYQALNEKANQLAFYLRETYDIKPDDFVGLEIERSDVFIVILIGILKSGAAYVPIDPNYPVERKQHLKKDSNCKVVVNEEIYNKFINQREIYSILNINKINDNRNLAYVIYTSGSTGLPKGIMMEHQSLKNLIVFHNEQFSIGEVRNVLQFTSISFDVSFQEIFTTLTIGATLFPISEIQKKDIDELEKFIIINEIETVFLPTAYFKMLIEKRSFLNIINQYLKNIIVAGEQLILNQDIIDIIKVSEFKLHNHYGPAETHVVSTCVLKNGNNIIGKIPSIGRPISNTQLYILDEELQLVPVGVTGKIYISGAGVARGYLDNAELTTEKFILNPFIEGVRMYDTGDLGYWFHDGNIEFLGRKDHQVKIRGYRIELGEIENIILQYSEDLKQVVVEVKENNQDKVLVAFLVSLTIIDKSELRSFLEKKLPEYMIPSFYVVLEDLPLTPNGKIDRKALPSISEKDIMRKEYLAPRNATEEKMVVIWQEILGVEEVGVTDNFFELGGHSIKILKLLSRINKEVGVKLKFNEVFQMPSIIELSKFLNDQNRNQYTSIESLEYKPYYRVSNAQMRLWIQCQIESNPEKYNLFMVQELVGDFKIELFKNALAKVIERHESLRTVFPIVNGEPMQQIIPSNEFPVVLEIVALFGEERNEKNLLAQIKQDNLYTFDLISGPLLRVKLYNIGESRNLLSMNIHHIIADGWSLNIFFRELKYFYSCEFNAKESQLPALLIHYKDFSEWQRKELSEKRLELLETFWMNKFKDLDEIKHLPYDRDNTSQVIGIARKEVIILKEGLTSAIINFSKKNEITLFSFYTGILALTVSKQFGLNTSCFGVPISGRLNYELENQIGYYLNTILVKSIVPEIGEIKFFLHETGSSILEMFDHQDYPFDVLIEQMRKKFTHLQEPFFDIVINMLNYEDAKIDQSSDLQFQIKEWESGVFMESKNPISIYLIESDGCMSLNCVYSEELFNQKTIIAFLNNFQFILTEIVYENKRNIEEIKLMFHDKDQEIYDMYRDEFNK